VLPLQFMKLSFRNTFVEAEDVADSKSPAAACRARSVEELSPSRAARERREAPVVQRLNHVFSSLIEPNKEEKVGCTSLQSTAVSSEQAPREYCHKDVPRTCDLAVSPHFRRQFHHLLDPMTTLMLCNVPNRYTQHDLLEDLALLGLRETLDFLYLPIDKATRASVGYAFVNFISPNWAASGLQMMQGYRFSRYGKDKEANVRAANLQGLAANIAHYQRCAVSTRRPAKAERHRPMLLSDGKMLPWPY